MSKSSDIEEKSGRQQVNELQKLLGVERDKLEFLDKIINTLPAIVYMFDIKKYKMVWCNRRHKEFVGFDSTGMKLLNDKGDLRKIYESDQNLALENIKGWRERSRKPEQVVIRITNSEGKHEYFYTDHHVFKFNEEGDPLWVIGVGININQTVHTEHEKRMLFSEDISITYQLLEEMSNRELKVLERLADGKSYKTIADELNLSLDGVRYHIRNMYQRLDVNTRAEAIKKALKYRLIQP